MCKEEHRFSTDMVHCVLVLCWWGIITFHYVYLLFSRLILSGQDFVDTHMSWPSCHHGSGQGPEPHFSPCRGPGAPDTVTLQQGCPHLHTALTCLAMDPQSQAHPWAHGSSASAQPHRGAQCLMWAALLAVELGHSLAPILPLCWGVPAAPMLDWDTYRHTHTRGSCQHFQSHICRWKGETELMNICTAVHYQFSHSSQYGLCCSVAFFP